MGEEEKTEEKAEDLVKAGIEANEILLKTLAKREEEIKNIGAAQKATDDLFKEQSEKYGTILEDLNAELKAISERTSKMEAELKDAGEPGAMPEELKLAGEKLTTSETFLEAVKKGSRNCDDVKVGSFAREMSRHIISPQERKVLSSNAASAGDLLIPFYDREIYKRPDRVPRLRDLLMVGPISESSVSYFLRTGFFPLSTTSTALEPAGETVIAVTTTDGFYVGQVCLFGTETHTISAVTPATPSVTIATVGGLAAQLPSGSRVSSQFVAPQTELSPKAQGDLTYDEQTRNVRTIAWWIQCSRQILSDVPQLDSEINNDLTYGLMLTLERELLYGDNTGTHLQGITTAAGIQTRNWSAGEAGDTRVDTIARGAGDCSSIDYPINGVVVHPFDLVNMNLEKAVDGHYLYPGGIENFLGFPVISSAAIAQGTALVGSFGFAAKMRDREEASIRMTDNYQGNFVENAIVILGEERVVQYVPLPEGFCHITFNAPPAP